MKLIAQGAEAKLYADGDRIIKDRFQKAYRLPGLDEKLRKARTKREAKILGKLPAGVPAPRLISTDGKKTIVMSQIKGDKVRDILEKNLRLCSEIGKKIALMHNAGIIHGDLTTSNMIYDKEVYFVDFGLSFFSEKIEDKAVDLHLMKRALESRHPQISQKAISLVLEGYSAAKDHASVLKRLEVVESRGRYKNKGI